MKREAIYIGILLSVISVFTSHAQQGDFPVLIGPYLGQQPPGDIPALFAPGVVSTGKEHSAAMFTPDGDEVWFGRLLPATIYYMKRIENKWTGPAEAPFCDTFNYLYPVLSQDGRSIFFSSDRPSGGCLPKGQVDIWMLERTAEGWTEPVRMNDNINLGRRNSCGSMAVDGSLYFTGKTSDKPIDIFCSKLMNGVYSTPENLAGINSPDADHAPFVAPDGSYLIISSFRGGLGRSDLFISFRTADGSWSQPKNMGPKINSAYKDEYPYVTPDGKYLFFNSNRPSSLNQKPIEDGPGNIYWVKTDIIEVLKSASSASH